MRGWWNMACWNGLSDAQQRELIEHGNLEIGYQPGFEARCYRGAEVAIETQTDEAPGPRFYCVSCAIQFLKAKKRAEDLRPPDPASREIMPGGREEW